MIIPEKLDDWSENTLKELIASNFEENDSIEYKSTLTPFDTEKNNLQSTFSSFANADGGFILFGIQQNRNPVPSKLEFCGVEIKEEPNLLISKYIQPLNPTPKFEQRVILVDNKSILIVKVFPSNDQPVQCSNGAFYLRMNGKKQTMPRYMLSDYFASRYIKQTKRQGLIFEIDLMLSVVKNNISPNTNIPIFSHYRTKELINRLIDHPHLWSNNDDSAFVTDIIQKLQEIERQKVFYDIYQAKSIAKLSAVTTHPLVSVDPHLTGPWPSLYDINARLSEVQNSLRNTLGILRKKL